MYGPWQTAGWPQYPVHPQLLQNYQQDPYGIVARQAWQAQMITPWNQPAINPWVIQALLGELVGAIARQNQLGHAGLGHVGLGQMGLGQGALGGVPFAAQPLQQFGSPLQSLVGTVPFIHQGSYGNSIGAGLPFTTGVGNWSVPAMAMV
jgi:hypothetical protein